ncbi:MAG: TauD/TfdA dioxygenase family protein [Acidimicrobiales bacterium]
MTALEGTSLDVRPLTGSFGADVHGLDLSRPLTQDQVAWVTAALAQYLVVSFRGQDLDIDQLEGFAKQLGDFGDSPFITPVDGHPNVLAVVREAEETGPLFGSGWHSDWSFQPAPPSATILYAKELPPHGGDTAFTNQQLAYETLSTGMQQLLVGLNGVHSARRSYGPAGSFGRPDPQAAMDIRGDERAVVEQLHPLVRVHPVNGRRSLFVNDVYTVGLEDMTATESAPLLDFLSAHSKQINHTCRVRWETGTVTMWDNRSVQHFAVNDYSGYRREMLRVTLAGEAPIPVT